MYIDNKYHKMTVNSFQTLRIFLAIFQDIELSNSYCFSKFFFKPRNQQRRASNKQFSLRSIYHYPSKKKFLNSALPLIFGDTQYWWIENQSLDSFSDFIKSIVSLNKMIRCIISQQNFFGGFSKYIHIVSSLQIFQEER